MSDTESEYDVASDDGVDDTEFTCENVRERCGARRATRARRTAEGARARWDRRDR